MVLWEHVFPLPFWGLEGEKKKEGGGGGSLQEMSESKVSLILVETS